MQDSGNYSSPKGRSLSTVLLLFAHPVVLRFTPGPAGGGLPPGFLSGFATPFGSGMIVQGGAVIVAGCLGRHIATQTSRFFRHIRLRETPALV